VLIEDGILVGYMQDRPECPADEHEADRPTAAARAMPPRADAAHDQHLYARRPARSRRKILASVKNGIYAANFRRRPRSDITSGKYVFQLHRGPYKIDNGKIGAPLKGAMLIGNGPTDLHRITMIGNDLALGYRHRQPAAKKRPGCAGSASASPTLRDGAELRWGGRG